MRQKEAHKDDGKPMSTTANADTTHDDGKQMTHITIGVSAKDDDKLMKRVDDN